MSITPPRKKSNRITKLNLKAKFNNNTVSSNISITYFEAFKKSIGFDQMIEDTITYTKYHNSRYDTHEIITNMINAIVLGHTRFSHMDTLRKDESYKKVMADKVPSEKVSRDLLMNAPEHTTGEMRCLNSKLLKVQASVQEPREVLLDLDDTVSTVYGHQQGTAIGYNPRYKGRYSYKEKICSISGTDEIVNISLENGRTHLNNGLIDYYNSCREYLPKEWIIKRVRADSAAFDQKNFDHWENESIEYVVKTKKYKSIKKVIDYVNSCPDQFKWYDIDKAFAMTEITLPLPSWEKARRFVLIRKTIPIPFDQLTIDDDWFKYEYSAIVTNIDYMTPQEIFDDYNQRCDIENNIDELKEGFAFDQNSQQDKKCNELFLLIKMLAFNLSNFFKRYFMPEKVRHHEIKTLRKILYRVPGNMVGNGKYRHIRYPDDDFLRDLIGHIRRRINEFNFAPV